MLYNVAANIGKILKTQLEIEHGSAYNGIAWKLTNDNGSHVLLSGKTKRELLTQMQAFRAGIFAAQDYKAIN